MALQVNTANLLIECVPYTITWSGGQAPYFLAITTPDDVGSVLENLGTQVGHSYTWKVDQPVSSKVVFAITDSDGTSALSGPSPPIAKGATSSCTNDSDAKPEPSGFPSPNGHNGTTALPPKNATSSVGGKNGTSTDGNGDGNDNDNDNDNNNANSNSTVPNITNPFKTGPSTASVTPDTSAQSPTGTSNVTPAFNSAQTNKRGVAALIGGLALAVIFGFGA